MQELINALQGTPQKVEVCEGCTATFRPLTVLEINNISIRRLGDGGAGVLPLLRQSLIGLEGDSVPQLLKLPVDENGNYEVPMKTIRDEFDSSILVVDLRKISYIAPGWFQVKLIDAYTMYFYNTYNDEHKKKSPEQSKQASINTSINDSTEEAVKPA